MSVSRSDLDNDFLSETSDSKWTWNESEAKNKHVKSERKASIPKVKIEEDSEELNASSDASSNEDVQVSAKEKVMSDQEKINTIFVKLNGPLTTYGNIRFVNNNKEYKGIQFFHAGYSKTDKLDAIQAIGALLINISKIAVTDEQIAVLRNGDLGKKIRIAARELAKELDMPKIATVRGLVAYVNSVQTSIVENEEKSEKSVSM